MEVDEGEESRRRCSGREKMEGRRWRQMCVLVEHKVDDSRGNKISHLGTLERKNDDGALEGFLTSFGALLPFVPNPD